MCNLYGLLIACPAFPYEYVVATYSLDYKWGRLKDPLTLWYSSKEVDQGSGKCIHADKKKSSLKSSQGTQRKPGGKGRNRGRNNPTPAAQDHFQRLTERQRPFITQNMRCLFDHRFPSLIESWPTLTQTQATFLLNNGFHRLSPDVVHSNGTFRGHVPTLQDVRAAMKAQPKGLYESQSY